jgi:hypothetical protein
MSQLERAAQDLLLQVYGARKYGSHIPTRMQWLMLGAALADAGVALPDNWDKVITE